MYQIFQVKYLVWLILCCVRFSKEKEEVINQRRGQFGKVRDCFLEEVMPSHFLKGEEEVAMQTREGGHA